MEKTEILERIVRNTEEDLQLLAPKLQIALKRYNRLKNHHAALVKQHLEASKELIILQGGVKKLPAFEHQSVSLNKVYKKAKKKATLDINTMSAKDKAALRKALLEGD